MSANVSALDELEYFLEPEEEADTGLESEATFSFGNVPKSVMRLLHAVNEGTPFTDVKAALEKAAVEEAIRTKAGGAGENYLTDLLFFNRYKSREGRFISKTEADYDAWSQKWLWLRDQVVRPILAKPLPAQSCPYPIKEANLTQRDPAFGKSCSGIAGSDVTPELVNRLWTDARCYVANAVNRLEYLAALPEAERQKIWDAYGNPEHHERDWFGRYDSQAFSKILENFRQIAAVLVHKRFRIVCNPKRTNACTKKLECTWGKAIPSQRVVHLKEGWIFNTPQFPEHERVQTIIHEAAHIVFVVSAEKKKYGPSCAKKLALQNRFKAMRNADNYGYYAMRHIPAYQAGNPAKCKTDYPVR